MGHCRLINDSISDRKRRMSLLVTILLSCITKGIVSQNIDGSTLGTVTMDTTDKCKEYTSLNEKWRMLGSSSGENCDRDLKTGWYRFFNDRGENAELPTVCIKTKSCGVNVPMRIDLEGNVMPEEGQMIKASVCGSYTILGRWDCCVLRRTTFIYNCGSFYVYKLTPPDRCSVGYCLTDASSDVEEFTAKTGEISFEKEVTPLYDVTTNATVLTTTASAPACGEGLKLCFDGKCYPQSRSCPMRNMNIKAVVSTIGLDSKKVTSTLPPRPVTYTFSVIRPTVNSTVGITTRAVSKGKSKIESRTETSTGYSLTTDASKEKFSTDVEEIVTERETSTSSVSDSYRSTNDLVTTMSFTTDSEIREENGDGNRDSSSTMRNLESSSILPSSNTPSSLTEESYTQENNAFTSDSEQVSTNSKINNDFTTKSLENLNIGSSSPLYSSSSINSQDSTGLYSARDLSTSEAVSTHSSYVSRSDLPLISGFVPSASSSIQTPTTISSNDQNIDISTIPEDTSKPFDDSLSKFETTTTEQEILPVISQTPTGETEPAISDDIVTVTKTTKVSTSTPDKKETPNSDGQSKNCGVVVILSVRGISITGYDYFYIRVRMAFSKMLNRFYLPSPGIYLRGRFFWRKRYYRDADDGGDVEFGENNVHLWNTTFSDDNSTFIATVAVDDIFNKPDLWKNVKAQMYTVVDEREGVKSDLYRQYANFTYDMVPDIRYMCVQEIVYLPDDVLLELLQQPDVVSFIESQLRDFNATVVDSSVTSETSTEVTTTTQSNQSDYSISQLILANFGLFVTAIVIGSFFLVCIAIGMAYVKSKGRCGKLKRKSGQYYVKCERALLGDVVRGVIQIENPISDREILKGEMTEKAGDGTSDTKRMDEPQESENLDPQQVENSWIIPITELLESENNADTKL